jgi:hypothetical protein
MQTAHKQVITWFVARSNQQWIVRVPDGRFWILPTGEPMGKSAWVRAHGSIDLKESRPWTSKRSPNR